MISKTSPNFFIKGFTIIELLIVIAIISIVSAIGIIGFGNYSKSQALQSAANDVATALNTAKSRSLSQVKPSICPDTDSTRLEGYKFKRVSQNQYKLSVRCGADHDVSSTLKLSSGPILFDTSFASKSEIYFLVLTGKVSSSGNIIITGPGGQRTIKVSDSGGINITNP